MRDVEAHEVQELEGAQSETGALAHHLVDVGEAGDAFADDAQALGDQAAAGVVDQEARRVGGFHRGVAHAFGDGDEGVGHPALAKHAADHLDKFHQRHRHEEVETGDPLRPFAGGGDGGDRQRRRVGGDDAVVRGHLLDGGEEGAFGLQLLDDGLDDDVAGGEGRQVAADHRYALDRGEGGGGVHPALLGGAVQHLGDEGAGLFGHPFLGVGDEHRDAGGGGDLRDAAPHDAGADDAHGQVRSLCVEHGAHLPS